MWAIELNNGEWPSLNQILTGIEKFYEEFNNKYDTPNYYRVIPKIKYCKSKGFKLIRRLIKFKDLDKPLIYIDKNKDGKWEDE